MTARDIIQANRGKAKSATYEIVDRNSSPKMLTLIQGDGSSTSIAYNHLYGVARSANGLRLEFSGHRVEIDGCNLEAIHEGLSDHRVTFLREAGGVDRSATTSIRRIAVFPNGRGGDQNGGFGDGSARSPP